MERKRSFKRKICIMLAASMIWLTASAVPSLAYFNRGAVQISLSQTSLSLDKGASASVSVTIDPIKEDQLPGCGMAECPQTCGSSGCLNENGECTCAGTNYKTYHSSVSVSSSNASVATASYSNGTLTVKGAGAGTAVITATGSMRQYTDASVTLNVTVKGSGNKAGDASDRPASQGKGASAAPASGMQASDIKSAGAAAQSSDSAAAKDPAAAAAPQDEAAAASDKSASALGELRNTKKGLYRIVELTDATDTAACFAQAAEEKSHIVFQKKSGENVKWSWTFDASDLGSADVSSLKLGINASAECPEDIKDAVSISGGNAYYMQFDHSGDLPAPAEIYINVSDVFPDNETLKLYHESENGGFEEISSEVMAENGYATFTIDSCSDYILTDGTVRGAEAAGGAREAGAGAGSASGGSAVPVALGAAAVIAVIAAAVVVLRKKKK